MSVEQSTFWNNLLSGFIGSLIGSGISLIAVFLQNKHASKLQVEALRLERRIAEEISFLDKVYKSMQSGEYALLKFRGNSERWQDNVEAPGFISNLLTFRSEVFNLISEFIEAVEYFNFLDAMVKHFKIRSDFTEDLEAAIQDLGKEFRNKFSANKQSFSPEEWELIKPKLEAINKLIKEFESWVKHNIALIMEQRREVLAIEKQ